MSLPGPVPKANPVRVNDKTLGMTVVRPDGVRRGRELPSVIDWHYKTLLWWNEWRLSPLSQLMEDIDWDVMEIAASIHHKLWSEQATLKPSEIAQLSKELDRKVGQFGATPADRLRLRIVIDNSPVADPDQEIDELDDEFGYGDLA